MDIEQGGMRRRDDHFWGGQFWIAAGVFLALGAAPLAGAAESAGAPGGFGPGGLSPQAHGPLDITADNAAYDNANCQSTWSGSAEVLQGDARLRAHVIHAFMKHKAATGPDQPACGAADRIEADGDVFYVTPDQRARGDHAVYSADENLIVMTGDVILVQGKNVVHGDRLTIHTQTRAAQMDSNAQGRGAPGRVRGVFYQSPEPGAPGAPAASH
jgi:lipopolysaccharide export system protein LptA